MKPFRISLSFKIIDTDPLFIVMKQYEKIIKARPKHSSIRQNSCGGQGSAHLIPGDVRIFAWLHVVIDVRAEDLFALAELSLLLPSHVGIVAQAGVILCHSQGHGHLHAVGGVSVSRGQTYLITFRFYLSAIHLMLFVLIIYLDIHNK